MIGPGDPHAGFSEPPANEEDWLTTYADAITLLMAFFVMLLSMAVIDQRRYEEVSESIRRELHHEASVPRESKDEALVPAGFKDEALVPTEVAKPVPESQEEEEEEEEAGERRTISEELLAAGRTLASMQAVAASLEALSRSRSCRVDTTDEAITIAFQGESLYAPASADLRTEAMGVLNEVAGALRNIIPGTITITVEGHTDDAPIHQPRFPSNWELSSQRATAVLRHLVSQGVDARLLHGIAYAHTRPVAPNRDAVGQPIAANRAKNRRVLIRIEH